MLKYLIILSIFTFHLSIFAKNANIDSVEIQLVNKHTNTEKLHFINSKAFVIKYSNTLLAIEYLDYG